MKKTIIVMPETQQHKAIDAIMNKMGFVEIERVATGGYMSSPCLIITYEGDPINYDENLYVEIPFTKSSTFYSVLEPDGFTGTLEDFASRAYNSKQTYEVKSL